MKAPDDIKLIEKFPGGYEITTWPWGGLALWKSTWDGLEIIGRASDIDDARLKISEIIGSMRHD